MKCQISYRLRLVIDLLAVIQPKIEFQNVKVNAITAVSSEFATYLHPPFGIVFAT